MGGKSRAGAHVSPCLRLCFLAQLRRTQALATKSLHISASFIADIESVADIWPIKLETWHVGRYMADKSTVAVFLRGRGDAWSSPAQIRAVVHVPDRTLRNWLQDLVAEGLVESQGERTGGRYRA